MAGNFTAAELAVSTAKADSIWDNSMEKRKYTPQAKALQVVLANQTAVLAPLTQQDKDNSLKMTWLAGNDIAATNGVPNCDIAGPELDVLSKDYALDIRKKADFQIDDEKLRKSEYAREEVAARGQLIMVKELDEILSRILLARLSGFAGLNRSTRLGTVTATTTTVSAANYTALGLVPEIIRAAILNRMGSDFYVLEGGELWADLLVARSKAQNTDGKTDLALFDQLTIESDLFNFASSGITEDAFIIANSAVAFGNKNRHNDAPEVFGGTVAQTRYTVPSLAYPGVKYDAFYQMNCFTPVGSDREHITHAWRAESNAGIWLNPSGLAVTDTGVLSLTKA